jgi:catechol 2,3-dioxygenase-like lactoylglutathione lyase family enzyme
MIKGAHVILYSQDAEADRAFLRDHLGFDHVDAGGGWLIFALPPAEVAVHPSETGGKHELFLICEDVGALVAELAGTGVACTAITEEGWGRLTRVTLPGGSVLGVYQSQHPMVHER